MYISHNYYIIHIIYIHFPRFFPISPFRLLNQRFAQRLMYQFQGLCQAQTQARQLVDRLVDQWLDHWIDLLVWRWKITGTLMSMKKQESLTYCWWFRNPAHQLRLVVEIPLFTWVWDTSQWCRISFINSSVTTVLQIWDFDTWTLYTYDSKLIVHEPFDMLKWLLTFNINSPCREHHTLEIQDFSKCT